MPAGQVYIALGSNQGQRECLLQAAIEQLEARVGPVTSRSSVYETEPVGFASTHLFLNQVIGLLTALPPEDVLTVTECIERELGRTEKSENGQYHNRCIDIDLLYYNNLIVQTPRLTLPHPRMQERRFVLEPLAEIAPALIHPVLKLSSSEMLQQLP